MISAALTFASGLTGCAWVDAFVQREPVESRQLAAMAAEAERTRPGAAEELLLLRGLRENPRDQDLRLQLADLLLEQDRAGEAVEQLEQVIATSSNDADARVRLARACRLTGQQTDARRHVDAALSIDPSHPQALLLQGEFAAESGRISDALEAYHHVLAVDSSNVTARLRIASLLLRSERCDQAAPLLRSVCASDCVTGEESAQARWLLGLAYGHEQRWTDAVHVLSSAIIERGETATADDWYRVAYARYRAGDREQSWDAVRQALDLQPDHINSLALAEMLRRESLQLETTIVQTGHTSSQLPRPPGW
ncbi:MAG: tetratricopeptide repeat protein [Planctomycetaceae bacterium]|nr:tetratricopeptide repeat protein [Planctomycetaceae bacterium]